MKYEKYGIAHDRGGYCLFHSEDLDWKQENKFSEIISSIAQNEIENEGTRNIDFEGVIFDDSINNLLLVDFKNKNLVLENSIINANIAVKKQDYKNAVSFKNANIKGNLSFADTSFNGIDFSEMKLHGDFYLTRANSKSYFYLDDANISGGLIFFNNTFNHVFSLNDGKVNTDPTFLRHTHFSACKFLNQVDFVNTYFKKAFVFNECTITDRVYFDNTVFDCDSYSPVFGAVHFSHNIVTSSGGMKFIGRSDIKLFDQAIEVVFESNQIDGEVLFENCNLQKVADTYRTKLVAESKQTDSKIFIGRGCLKYRNQSPIRTVPVNVDNQNLVIDLCNTFSKFFSRSIGYNLGLEIIEKTDNDLKYFYFSDEPVEYETFLENLNASEINMWSLIRIDKQAINGQYVVASGLTDKLINTTDTIIDLAGIILKIASRIPLLKLTSTEINNILSAANFAGKKLIDSSSISVINVHQNILLGIGNVQSVKI